MSGGEMMVQTERENSSDGSNGKMTEMVSGKRCWLFEMFRAGGGVFLFGGGYGWGREKWRELI